MSRTISISKRNGDVANRETMQRQLDCMLNTIANGDYVLTVTKRETRRSLDQNALMWMWFTCIEGETGTDKQDIHDYCCRMFNARIVEINGEPQKVASGTSKLTTFAMTDFLNKVQAWAASELGITLPTPEDIAWQEFESYYKQFNH